MSDQRHALPLVAALALTGCNLAPAYVRPQPAVPPQWPTGPAYAQPADTAPGPDWNWQSVLTDPRLRTVVARALSDNRSLQATVATVASARAQYRIQAANRLPTIAATAGTSLRRGVTSRVGDTSSYDANFGLSSFEIDLFGRQKNLSKQAFEQYLASDAGLASTRIALVAATATGYVTLAADRDILAVARATLQSGRKSLELTKSLYDAGLAPMSDVANAETIVAQARSDVEQDITIVAQDRNALDLLAGGTIEDALLPTSLSELENGIAVMPAGLTSQILMRRPDVLQAEHQVKAADAGIGAARAAFFPKISLTAMAGVASTALSSLFTGGAFAMTTTPTATLPLLGGTNRGNLAYARSQRDYYAAQYQYTIQTAFREVSDGLARRGTIDRQRAAQADLVSAATRSAHAADTQYRAGTDTFLNALIAQRTLYGARQTQVSTVLDDLLNRISLYEYVGSDGSFACPTGNRSPGKTPVC